MKPFANTTFLSTLVIWAAAAICAVNAHAASPQPQWEIIALVEADATSAGEASSPHIDISVRNGKIDINVDRHCQIEIFTILGQLVTKKKVSPGTVRLTLDARGVYILKAGTTTRRINL
ncbi:MAG: T9SS type A sorting domain-containing protein [Muribaculaceae bacterium]|nr:T9SS type A sorting domain-containing protein [Muribaculaceae bacterium]